MSNTIKLAVIVFISVHTSYSMFNEPRPLAIDNKVNTHKLQFNDPEKEVIKNLTYKQLLILSQTSMRNNECIHNWIEQKIIKFFNNLKKKFSQAQLTEEKVRILYEGFELIKERYVQKSGATFRALYNNNPCISVLEIVIQVANNCIKEELGKNLDSNSKTRYATVYWNFFESIIKNPYVSKKDKKRLIKGIDKKIKKLKVSCLLPHFPQYKSIRLLLWEKKSINPCVIF